jgi:hypothetical protein
MSELPDPADRPVFGAAPDGPICGHVLESRSGINDFKAG